MKTFNYTVRDQFGIHARPAALLARESQKYNCKITISFNGQSADASDAVAIMGMNLKLGNMICLEVTGREESLAYAGLRNFLSKNPNF